MEVSTAIKAEEKWKEIGKRLSLARCTRGMTRAELGKALDLSEQTVGAWERGQRNLAEQLGAVSRVLGVSPSWLLDGVDSPALSKGSDPETLLRITEQLGDTYRNRKSQLNGIERAMYEYAIRELARCTLPPLEADAVISEHDKELDAQRQRAAQAREARIKSSNGTAA